MIFKNHYQLDSRAQVISVTLKGKQTRHQDKAQSRGISKYVNITSRLQMKRYGENKYILLVSA